MKPKRKPVKYVAIVCTILIPDHHGFPEMIGVQEALAKLGWKLTWGLVPNQKPKPEKK